MHCLDVWGEDKANKMVPEYSVVIVEKYIDANEPFRRLVEAIKSKRNPTEAKATWHDAK